MSAEGDWTDSTAVLFCLMTGMTSLSKPRLARLHGVLQSHAERSAAPGLVSIVARKGEVNVDVIGSSAVRDGHRLGEDANFRISSMTQPVTVVATLILIEEFVLRLDEPVERLLPELGERRVARHIEGPVDDTVPAMNYEEKLCLGLELR